MPDARARSVSVSHADDAPPPEGRREDRLDARLEPKLGAAEPSTSSSHPRPDPVLEPPVGRWLPAEQVLVVIPAFNESGSIAAVVHEVLAMGPRFVPIVIDDGSSDGTRTVAKAAGARVVTLPSNLGIGGAVQTGIRAAFRDGFGFCAQVDGDGQHIATELNKLLAARAETGAHIVVGSRYIGDLEGDRSTRMRRFGSRVIARAIAIFFGGARVSDPTSGLRLLDRSAIRLFAGDYPHDYPEPISAAVALRNGLRIIEVPVAMRARQAGRSSIAGLRTLSYMIRVIFYIAVARLRRPANVHDHE
jgi:glycosyltransferase involved in cell wall biosynthesis